MEYASAGTRWFACENFVRLHLSSEILDEIRSIRALFNRTAIVHCWPDNSANRFTARYKIWKIQRRKTKLWMPFAKMVISQVTEDAKYHCTRVPSPRVRLDTASRYVSGLRPRDVNFMFIIEIGRLNRWPQLGCDAECHWSHMRPIHHEDDAHAHTEKEREWARKSEERREGKALFGSADAFCHFISIWYRPCLPCSLHFYRLYPAVHRFIMPKSVLTRKCFYILDRPSTFSIIASIPTQSVSVVNL